MKQNTNKNLVLENGTNDPLSRYLQEIAETPLLERAQEKELMLKIENGDEEARQLFIKSNLRLVVSIARRYRRNTASFSLLDLIQEGNIGLMKAVGKFDWRFGCKFSTYATWWIKEGIRRSLQDKDRMIRVPVYNKQNMIKVYWASIKLFLELGREGNSEEIAEELSITIEQAEESLRCLRLNTSSLNEKVSEEDGDTQEFQDLLVSPGNSIEEILEDKEVFEGEISRILRIMEEVCNERDFRILKMRFGIGTYEGCTLEEVGKHFGVTRERIRQIQDQALGKIKKTIALQDMMNES